MLKIGYNHPTVIPLPADKPKDGVFVDEPSRFSWDVSDVEIIILAESA